MAEIITTLNIEDVYPSPKHYREVDPANVKTLADSIKVAGQLDPVRVFKDGEIYYIDSGHHRLAALKLLGAKTIEAIVDDGESPTAMVASNMHFPETELEHSRGTQLLLQTGVRPLEAAALTGESQDKVTRAKRGMELVDDPTAWEDLTLDRLASIADFEDDAEAVEKLTNAHENEWRGILSVLKRDKDRVENIAKAEEIVKAAGCTLIIDIADTREMGLRYLDRSDTAPEGAAHARISSFAWNPSVEILWYGPAQAEDPEKQRELDAAREQEALVEAELEKAAERRVAFVVDFLGGNVPGASNALRDLAVELWEGIDDREGIPADSAELVKEPWSKVVGFLARVYASILASVESGASTLLSSPDVPYYRTNYLEDTLAYLEALETCELELTDVEKGLLVELTEDEEDEPTASAPASVQGRKVPVDDGFEVYGQLMDKRFDHSEVFLGIAADSNAGDALLAEWARADYPVQDEWDVRDED